MKELLKLQEWLLALDPNDHYCGYELEFGIDRSIILEYIEEQAVQLLLAPDPPATCLCGELAVRNDAWCTVCFPDTGRS